MGLYSRYVMPRLVHLACSAESNRRQRLKVVPNARGKVLEVGVGSGLNLPFYDPATVESVVGIDPSVEMMRMAEGAAGSAPVPVRLLDAGAEAIPLGTASVDTVVLTYTLCTIPDAQGALREMVRVLAPGGQLLFCEHGAAPDPSVLRRQKRYNPVWRRLAGGCNLDRDIPALIGEGGFRITNMDTMYIPGWQPAAFNFWGRAEPVAGR